MTRYIEETCKVTCEDNGKSVVADILSFNEKRNLTVSLNKSLKVLMTWNGHVYESRQNGLSFVSTGPKITTSTNERSK
jgi:hypothetical protein